MEGWFAKVCRRRGLKGVRDRVVDWIWSLCNMAFESYVVHGEWRYVVTVPLYKSKGERNEYKN